jgi:hypothetical protein
LEFAASCFCHVVVVVVVVVNLRYSK